MEETTDERRAVDAYRHYMNIQTSDLLAEYASMKVRGNRSDAIEAAVEAAFEDRRDEMDDYMLTVQKR